MKLSEEASTCAQRRAAPLATNKKNVFLIIFKFRLAWNKRFFVFKLVLLARLTNNVIFELRRRRYRGAAESVHLGRAIQRCGNGRGPLAEQELARRQAPYERYAKLAAHRPSNGHALRSALGQSYIELDDPTAGFDVVQRSRPAWQGGNDG